MTRPRIDLVSPLPPVRSGIADYTADLLDALAARSELRLVRLPEQPVREDLIERFEVVGPEDLGQTGRIPLYQMGNNEHHRDVWDLALATPGVLTLHDLVLHHFVVHRTFHRGDREGYRRELEAAHGWIGRDVAAVLGWPGAHGSAGLFALPAHRRLLEAQRGVVVHSAWARRELEAEMPGLPVAEVPMGIPLPDAADEGAGIALRRSLGLGPEVPLLASVGFQTPMKRTDAVVRALADPRLAGTHLVVAGQAAPAVDLAGEARRAGVVDRVHLLGYVPFSTFEQAIAASDVCVNLRYPTAGETSASLLRILAVGRPVVVSDHAQLAELDLDGVARVAPGPGEETALAAAVAELLADRARARGLAAAARDRIARRHRPEDAAAAVVAACERLAAEPAGAARSSRAACGPPTSLAHRPLRGELEVEGAEAPWPVGVRRNLRIRVRNLGPARWLAGERPEGGIALQIRLWRGDRDLWADRGWTGLPFDLEAGDEVVLSFPVRRPPGTDRVELILHALGRDRLDRLGGPGLELRLEDAA